MNLYLTDDEKAFSDEEHQAVKDDATQTYCLRFASHTPDGTEFRTNVVFVGNRWCAVVENEQHTKLAAYRVHPSKNVKGYELELMWYRDIFHDQAWVLMPIEEDYDDDDEYRKLQLAMEKLVQRHEHLEQDRVVAAPKPKRRNRRQ